MKWYLAKLVFRIVCGNGNHLAQFDEQLRLVLANDRFEALDKAAKIGRQEEEAFYNNHQQLVSWQFINIAEMHAPDVLIDGAELCSHIREVEDADSYISFVHHKAAALIAQRENQFYHLI